MDKLRIKLLALVFLAFFLLYTGCGPASGPSFPFPLSEENMEAILEQQGLDWWEKRLDDGPDKETYSVYVFELEEYGRYLAIQTLAAADMRELMFMAQPRERKDGETAAPDWPALFALAEEIFGCGNKARQEFTKIFDFISYFI